MEISVVGEFPGTPAEALLDVARYSAGYVARRLGPLDDPRPISLLHTKGDPRIYADSESISLHLAAADRHWPKFAVQFAFFVSALTLKAYERSGSNRWFVVAASASCALQVLRDIAEADRAATPYANIFAVYADACAAAGNPVVADLGPWVAQREAQFEKLGGEYDPMLAPVANAIGDALGGMGSWRGLKSMPDANLPASAFLPVWRAELATGGG